MSDTENNDIDRADGPGEALFRATLHERFDNLDVQIPECRFRGCDTEFVGMRAEDYAIHLFREHPFTRRHGPDKLLKILAGAINDAKENRSVDTDTEQ